MKKRCTTAALAALLLLGTLSACASGSSDNTPNSDASVQSVSQEIKESLENAESSKNEDEISTLHTFYFKDSSKSSQATATLFNSANGKSENIEMKKIGEDDDFSTFSCEGDTSVYNMAYVTYSEDNKTLEFAFNKCVSGWCKTEDDFFPYTEGDDIDYTPEFDDFTITGYGWEKTIHVWKPEDYDASSSEKYSTIYLLDGQNLAKFDRDYFELSTRPGVLEQIRSSQAEAGTKTIVVAVENHLTRDYELVPELEFSAAENENELLNVSEPVEDEDADFDGMSGSQFAYFMANKLVPYIQQNYNVYTDAAHTSVTGNSLGGLESFYMTVEYPEVFGSVGALSPSFMLYNESQWEEYLSKKTFGADSPLLYLYTGPAGSDTDPDVTNMYNRLKEMGYPQGKLILHYNENGAHSHIYWRSVFSEYLEAMFFQKVEPLY